MPGMVNKESEHASLHSFSEFIRRYLPGKIQKISVNAGFSCPNRDGSKGTGGCIYCNNASFSPGYTLKAGSISMQIEEGQRFFSRKYPSMKYLAYFQSYTATNAPLPELMAMFEEALSVDNVVGIIVGTRPDCMPQPLLDYLARLSRRTFVMVEYGAESASDETLLRINRGHTWADTADAVRRTAQAGIPVGLHLILGLPGENESDIMNTIDRVNSLPVDTLKCHQMQVIRGTRLARDFERGECDIMTFSAEEYAGLCIRVLRRLRPDIMVERFVSQAPAEMLLYPRWGMKNYQFADLLRRMMARQ